MHSTPIVFFLLAVGAGAQLFQPLDQYRPEFITQLLGVETGAALYVISTDKTEYLQNIKITSGGMTRNAYDVATSYTGASGRKSPWLLASNQVFVASSNNDTVTNTLKGFLYITTAKQAADPNFFVYDAIGDVRIDMSTVQTGTIVVLNPTMLRNSLDTPIYNSIVTNITQKTTSSMQIFTNFPPAVDPQNIVTRIFVNPMKVKNGTQFFTNIEPLQIPYSCYYIAFTGGIQLRLRGAYAPMPVQYTTATTTTGLVVNTLWATNVTVRLQRDPSTYRTTGYICTIWSIIDFLQIRIEQTGGGIFDSNYTQPINNAQALSDIAGDIIYVVPQGPVSAFYAIQYVAIEGGPLPSTVSAPTTTTSATTNASMPPTTPTIPTTTRSAPAMRTSLVLLTAFIARIL